MTTLYGIKNCDSVKKTRKWLNDQHIHYQYHDFREHGLTEALIQQWLAGCSLEQLINKKSTSWKNLTEDEKSSLNNNTAIALCMRHETLIKRPVLAHQGNVYFGFDEKLYTTLLLEQQELI
jgi:arsenate reductase